jgi:hypothetical protein
MSDMPRVCTICSHPDRRRIEAALVACEPNRRIASRFGVEEISIRRHAAEHVHATLSRARDALEVSRGDELLAQIQTALAKTWALLATAEVDGDYQLQLKALAGLDKRLELLARCMGELKEQHVYNIVMLPEWQQLRELILTALGPFPEARDAVVAALRGAAGRVALNGPDHEDDATRH